MSADAQWGLGAWRLGVRRIHPHKKREDDHVAVLFVDGTLLQGVAAQHWHGAVSSLARIHDTSCMLKPRRGL